ncbi:DUF4270 family protein [Chitinophaga sp. sic0106]|uniref:DUF4270 family protein n=1 Tax=Chitinophaga sp. sic0106 TaxID=2854785 RepID=UPI001C4955D4|nr:DUF4270 domain-containing protein [Chitinophaga sp. sic0106]
MKIKFRNLSYIAAIVSVLYVSSGCNEATLLGKNLIPPGDLVNATDTTITGIITHNVLQYDSSIINGYNYYNKTLGSITADPVFGKTHAFVYMQVGLPSSGFTFEGVSQTLDSVVLSISYGGYTGDSTTPQTFSVYRMNETGFKIDSNYAYNKPLKYDPSQLLGTATVTPLTARDSVSVYGAKETAQIRIKLSNAFGNELLAQKSDGAFKNDSAFAVFLNGLAIVPDTVQANHKNMMYVTMNSTNTKLTVFYKNTTTDSLRAAFTFNSSSSAHSNYFARNFNGSEAGNYINTANPLGDSLLFIQAQPGLATKFTIPGLENFPNVLINNAELIITQVTVGESDQNNIYSDPTSLILRQYTNGDSTKLPIDASAGTAYYGGTKQVVTNFGGMMISQYKFTLNHYLQMLIKKTETNNGFILMGYSPLVMDVNRLKAGGGNHSQYSMKLRVIYTKP